MITKIEQGDCIQIPVSQIEYREGGDTLWIHGPAGGTVLRIKVLGAKIESRLCNTSPCSHADVAITAGIEFCLGPEAVVEGESHG